LVDNVRASETREDDASQVLCFETGETLWRVEAPDGLSRHEGKM
jgi:hypothetical protein